MVKAKDEGGGKYTFVCPYCGVESSFNSLPGKRIEVDCSCNKRFTVET